MASHIAKAPEDGQGFRRAWSRGRVNQPAERVGEEGSAREGPRSPFKKTREWAACKSHDMAETRRIKHERHARTKPYHSSYIRKCTYRGRRSACLQGEEGVCVCVCTVSTQCWLSPLRKGDREGKYLQRDYYSCHHQRRLRLTHLQRATLPHGIHVFQFLRPNLASCTAQQNIQRIS